MIRLRHQDRTTTVVDKMEAIEILDSSGRLGGIILTERTGTIRLLTPEDPLFKGYAKAHRMPVAKVSHHEIEGMESAL